MARIALYGAGGSPYHHAAILARAGHAVAFVFPADIIGGALAGFDAFVMPGGGYRAMQGQLEPLGAVGCRSIRDYVAGGGTYIGSCAGSYDAATVPARFLRVCPEQAELCLLEARVWNDGESVLGVIQSPGIGELEAVNAAPEHPVMAGMPATFRITHYNGPLFVGGHALARVGGPTSKFTPAEEFLQPATAPRLIDQAVEAGVANIVAGEFGAGKVVLFGSHPEFGSSLAMDDVGIAATMLRNAVAWAGDGQRDVRATLADRPVPDAVRDADLHRLPQLVDEIAARCAALSKREEPPWLAPSAAMALFGRTGAEVWADALRQLPAFAAAAAAGAPDLGTPLLSYRPPADWSVDGGFHGVVPLLEQAVGLLARAEENWSGSYRAEDPYEHLRDSQYHLVAGSYLAAVGRAASAALLTRMTPPRA
ncbi:BPL-N domain-containing protein [Rugosimonospora africana]|uniref:Biotin-protein ligase N-terminal domain-containing protein n=1 Tax=Rugosimonospora africana TaxID=556532 RepID=A0A8J3R2D4_9ACTN|nr:BPL-N domain-containing protein [Rugosimonospora africana]GIH21198.1 hypothetical protein Raf01_93700 [Rugosimonospora africana]